MDRLAMIVLVAGGVVSVTLFAVFGAVSVAEGERRAARRAFAIALVCAIVFLGGALLAPPIRTPLFWLVMAAALAVLVLLLLPIGHVAPANDTPRQRRDERNVMFARARLQPGSPEFEAYYAAHPENLRSDDEMRQKPGLLAPDAEFADSLLFAAADASFDLTEALRDAVDGPVAEFRHELPPERLTAFVKGLAQYYGARDVGVTRLSPVHVYSHVGRGSGVYGEPISLEHDTAIAFTVEMERDMTVASPHAPAVAESAHQYVESARVAVQLAAALRGLGYPARAHIDGNYRVIAPLVARDAGLGEIGRIGLLMTPQLGPRVRLGVVTTNANLVADKRRQGTAVIDFCTICSKCADNCPANAIAFGDRVESDGALCWKIDPDACYRYWCIVGTDCGVCLNVCPYSHPDNPLHNLVRRGIARSGFFRRAVKWLDDVFYGREPARRDAPSWTRGQ
jgi:NAD-dependent dihydropyrimidine dehydrogenase PreA subunit